MTANIPTVFYTSGVARRRGPAMFKKGLTALVVGVSVFVGYLWYAGVTLHDCQVWVEQQAGQRPGSSDLKATPYPAYGPVVVPR